jgi:hypothetical protein
MGLNQLRDCLPRQSFSAERHDLTLTHTQRWQPTITMPEPVIGERVPSTVDRGQKGSHYCARDRAQKRLPDGATITKLEGREREVNGGAKAAGCGLLDLRFVGFGAVKAVGFAF